MRQTRQIMVGTVAIGGGAPVSIQSMTNTLTSDAQATLAQIQRLAALGCDLARVAVPSQAEISSLSEICLASPLPVIADIHFDYRLALASIDAGASCIRLNPGNVKNESYVRQVARAARDAGCAVRIGVNGGSLA
ncbi:MAG: flavodoxin-dependent (E)-4-hydroxy-3-methylbut-2-enyl-diphosphate synthase, partial [Chloroflexi bacterium]|nr:flavodoxin-dependent (E)-4-hydroxy-3-methylbut-2-enyl-diphosphate synthase [Chloroflexota bacterium]